MFKKIIYYLSFSLLFVIASSVVFHVGNVNKLSLLNGHVGVEVDYVASFFKTFELQDIKALSAALDVVLQDPGFKDVFLEGNREKLNQYGQPLFQKIKEGYGITHFYFILPDSIIFLRLHNPEIYGDINNRITFEKAVESKNIGFGIELGKTAFALRVVKPYYDGDKLIGYIELGQEIDHFLSVLKEETENEYSIFVNKDKLNQIDWEATRKNNNKDNNWENFSKMIATNSTLDLDDTENELVKFCFNENTAQNFFSSNSKGDSIINFDLKMACSGVLIQDASGSDVGVLLFGHDLSDRIISYGSFINGTNIFIIGLLFFTILVTIFVSMKSFASENKFKFLFESSLDAIMTIRPPDWKFFDGNKATLKLFGLKDIEELRNAKPSDLSPKYQADGRLSSEKAQEMINLALKNGMNSFEWTHKKINGPEFFAQVSLNKIGKSNNLQALVRDVTDQKVAFEAVKQSEAKIKKAFDETQKMNKLMVGRELEMIKLKKEVATLKKLGKAQDEN